MADEISREALLIYLNDIRTLETIIHESDSKYNIIRSQQKSHITDKTAEPSIPQYPKPSIVSKIISAFVIFLGVIFIASGIFMSGLKLNFVAIPMYIMGIVSIIIAIKIMNESKKKYEEDIKKYPLIFKEYKEKCQQYKDEAPQRQAKIDAENKKIDKFNEKIHKSMTALKSDIESSKKLLDQAYSANIIPSQFRNINSICSLYDYLSTSNESLTDALLHCKFDEMINLQSTAIIQQAQANAVLCEQNQRILETAQATMENTAVAAKYAQISAVNSELSLKLQKKQFEYQRI